MTKFRTGVAEARSFRARCEAIKGWPEFPGGQRTNCQAYIIFLSATASGCLWWRYAPGNRWSTRNARRLIPRIHNVMH
jgi:hypothetical protein